MTNLQYLHFSVYLYSQITNLMKRDASHSTECKLMPTTQLPEICFALCDPETLTFWRNIKWLARNHDGLSMWQVLMNTVSVILVLSCRHTDADEHSTQATLVGMSNNTAINVIHTNMSVSKAKYSHHHHHHQSICSAPTTLRMQVHSIVKR